jgi:NADH-quinone oxidoreductase subunit C
LSSADVEQAEATESAPVDEVRTHLLTTLTEVLGDAIVGSHIEKGDLWVRVRLDAWRAAAEACKTALECDYFCYLSGIDWMPSSVPNPEEAAAEVAAADVEAAADAAPTEAEPEAEAARAEAAAEGEAAPAADPAPAATPGSPYETGYAGGDTRFQVLARLYSTSKHWGVTLKADLPEDAQNIESWVSLYRGAEWHERECWEMYGFQFGHALGMRHLYLPGEFEGHPLRKDFPLLAREVKPWPGLVDIEPMPGDEEGEGEGDATEGGDAG